MNDEAGQHAAERRRANRRLGWMLAGLSATFALGFVVKIVTLGG